MTMAWLSINGSRGVPSSDGDMCQECGHTYGQHYGLGCEPAAPRPTAEPITTGFNQPALEIVDRFRALFPNGHPGFIDRCVEEAKLHNDKNHDYAAGGRPLGNFERVAAILSLYPGFPVDKPYGVAIVYALKQVDAVLWGLANDIEHKVEGYDSRCQDISVYFKLALIMIQEWQNKSAESKTPTTGS